MIHSYFFKQPTPQLTFNLIEVEIFYKEQWDEGTKLTEFNSERGGLRVTRLQKKINLDPVLLLEGILNTNKQHVCSKTPVRGVIAPIKGYGMIFITSRR